MSNADRFLNAYAQIEKELKRILDVKRHPRFYELLDLACKKNNQVIHKYKCDLKEFGDLRNAIVHNRAGGKIIAQPTDDTVEKIEKIARLLLKPPQVLPLFQKKVVTISANAPLSNAIKSLGKYNYSQLPIIKEGMIIGLLTSNMIIRWLSTRLDDREVKLDDREVKLDEMYVQDLLPFSGTKDNYKIVPATTTLFEAQEHFFRYQEKSHKLESVLITENGKPDEKLLGIITNLDLPLLQKEL